MCELRAIGTELVATPLVPTPPIAAVRARADRYIAVRRRRNALVASVVLGLTVTGITKLTLTSSVDTVRLVGDPNGPDAPATSTTTTTVAPLPALDADASFLPLSGRDFNGEWDSLRRNRAPQCPLRADPKLPAIRVLVGSVGSVGSVVGVAGEPSPDDAVRQAIYSFNAQNSICGRAIELLREHDYTDIPADVVAVLGLPLDPELDAAVADGRFERTGLPVVGGDGLAAAHHSSPGVYPVGTSAAALSRLAARHGLSQGARTFAVVHDTTRPFGPEAATAFTDYVRQAGGDVKASIGIDPAGKPDPGHTKQYSLACGNRGCDVVFLALLPETAATWLAANPHAPRIGAAGLPTLLTSGFADACFATSADRCHGMTAWSGFVTPFGRHAHNLEALYSWTGGTAATSSRGSAMTQAAVVSTRVLIEALLEAGPQVTRARLHHALQRLRFVSDVTPPMRWASHGPRLGNPYAQAWVLTAEHASHAVAHSSDWAAGTSEQQGDYYSRAPEHKGSEEAAPIPTKPDPRFERQWRDAGTGWRSDPQ